MADLAEILKGFFHYEDDFNKEYKLGLDRFYEKSTAVTKINSETFQLEAVIGHINVEKNYQEAVIYIPDNVLNKTSEEFCLPPFQFIPSCNYMYYGCYMSIACYLQKIEPKYITLYHSVDNNEKYVLNNRPEIAKIFLQHRKRSLNAIAAKQNGITIPEPVKTLELYQ